MKRKRWTPKTEISPELLSFRDKRKWQISFRRYVLQKMPCPAYAPYFGLDIASLREWFERQFTGNLNWENFGKEWQFEHIIPVSYFDHSVEEDLALCWNFTNIRVTAKKDGVSTNLDVLGAESYFEELFAQTGYFICQKMTGKIKSIVAEQLRSATPMINFIKEKSQHLGAIAPFREYEYELLNAGRTPAEVTREIEAFKQMGGQQ